MKWTLACATAFAAVAALAGATTLPAGAETAVATAHISYTPGPDVLSARPHPMVVAAQAAPARWWKVRSGDTLSGIAKARYQSEAAWTLIYWTNHKHIKWANRIQVGQTFYLPDYNGHAPVAPKLLEPLPPPPPVVVATSSASGGSGLSSGYHPVYRRHHSYTAAASGTYHGSGSMQSCIIARESGGNSQVTNSSGHYGLYQFSASTWVASGGSASSFGHASVGEQNQVFNNAVAARGYSDWAPYDGC